VSSRCFTQNLYITKSHSTVFLRNFKLKACHLSFLKKKNIFHIKSHHVHHGDSLVLENHRIWGRADRHGERIRRSDGGRQNIVQWIDPGHIRLEYVFLGENVNFHSKKQFFAKNPTMDPKTGMKTVATAELLANWVKKTATQTITNAMSPVGKWPKASVIVEPSQLSNLLSWIFCKKF